VVLEGLLAAMTDARFRNVWMALLLGGAVAGGCRSFRPEIPPEVRNEEGRVVLDERYLHKKQTVEAGGRFEGERFHATRFDVEDQDDEIEVLAPLVETHPGGGRVGGVEFETNASSRVLDGTGETIPLADLVPGSWVKAECKEKDGRLLLRKIQMREEPGLEEELQGRIDSIEKGLRNLFIGGVPVVYDHGTPVVWKTDEVPPPSLLPEDSEVAALFRKQKGVRKINRIRDEDRRPEEQLVLGDFLTVGGEVRYDTEWRDNHDLNNDRHRDRLVHGVGGKLELSFDLAEGLFGFVQVTHGQRFVHFDQDQNLDFDPETRLGEAFLLAEDFPLPGVAVQVGRQTFDQGREWVFDHKLDAVRTYVNLDRALLELSVSEKLVQESNEEDDVWNLLAGLHAEPLPDQDAFLYLLQRTGGELVDLDRFHYGLSLDGKMGTSVEYWLDAGGVSGKEDDTRVQGYGFDAMVMKVFEGVSPEPSLVFGYARGSGDDRPDRGEDRSFRQTGLHDNNDKFNGVTSFRYLGELLRPELSNLQVFTAGVGLKAEKDSVDLVYHHYRQVESADFLRDTRLRRRPDGTSPALGDELDLVIGIERWFPVEIELVLAWFTPGGAFGPRADDAWFGTFRVKWVF